MDWYRQSPALRNGTAFPKPADNLDGRRREKERQEQKPPAKPIP